MKLVWSFIVILFVSLNTLYSGLTFAQGGFSATITTIKANSQNAKQQVLVKNKSQAAQMAQRRFGGKVLKVNKQNLDYRVKLIKKNGHVISVVVNAKSGNISGR